MKIHFPHYIQLDSMDCGPTCLRIDKGNTEAIVLLVIMYKKETALCLD